MRNNSTSLTSGNYLNLIISGILITGFFFTGCVSSKKLAEVRDQRDQLEADLSECRRQNSSLQSEVNNLSSQEEQLGQLRSANSNLENQLQEARSKINQLEQQEPDCPEAMTDGIVFKVQIGAFEKREISDDLDSSVNLDIENRDGMNAIVVGQFRDYFQADALQNHLRAMGVSEAWIVPYRDGNRVALDDVIDTIVE